MNELKKIAEYLKQNATTILLLINTISFTNYYIFYKSFNISIFSYLSLNDLVFFTLEYIFKILLIIIVYEIVFFTIFTFFWIFYEKIILIKHKKIILFFKSNKRNQDRIHNALEKHFDNGLKNTKYTIASFGFILLVYFPFKLIIFPAYLVYFIYLIGIISKEKRYNLSISFISFIIILSMIITTIYSSYTKRFEKEDFEISFKENSRLITTAKDISSLNYLGETSTNIFLYDIKHKKVKIYNKENISEYEIKNSTTIDEYIKKIKDSYIVRSLY